LAQIIFDFISLLLIIYFTGGIESPLYAFYIFHVIIGSLILSGNIVRLMISIVLIISLSGALLEAKGIIPHYAISGLFATPLYNNYNYIISFFTVFGLSLFLSIYLANSVARQLYSREKALTKAYMQLEEAEKSKSKYVMSVVHDLKTPIAAAMTHINNLEGGIFGEIPADMQRPLDRIKIRMTNAIETINDILQISQIRLEEDIEKVENINLKDMFEDIESDMHEIIESKKLNYNFRFTAKPDDFLQANPRLIKLALSNILSNAVKYTDEGGSIDVIIEDHINTFEISVTDNGMGIPEKEQEKIFQDFFRSSVSKQRNIEGTGLGMSIVLQIIKKYNGYIKVYSPSYLRIDPVKPGTQFIITIPKMFSILPQTN
jgi:signal transduction histidine kinase